MFCDFEDHNDDSICQITAQYDHNRRLEIDHESQKHSFLVYVKTWS